MKRVTKAVFSSGRLRCRLNLLCKFTLTGTRAFTETALEVI
jgi:hypothetical protein